ncbi:transposase [Streptomyces sp. NPDC006476]|uniref:transposase n=1 Tax=Streptomyces sp. NPDC006476 TaxID=3157175 RepID=UPI0033BA1629
MSETTCTLTATWAPPRSTNAGAPSRASRPNARARRPPSRSRPGGMLERALAAPVPFTYFLADEAYGQCRALRAWLEEHQVRYVLAIPKDEVLALPDGRTQQARELWALVPEDAFERRSCTDGAKEPREYDWTAIQLASVSTGLERHLLIRRSTVPSKKDKKAGQLVREIAYFLCHTPPGHDLGRDGRRRRAALDAGRVVPGREGEWGLDEHEVRKSCSWYRHTTVRMLAMGFLVRPEPANTPTIADTRP